MKQTPNGTTNMVKKYNSLVFQVLFALEEAFPLLICGKFLKNPFSALCVSFYHLDMCPSTTQYNFASYEWNHILHILLCPVFECYFVRFIQTTYNVWVIHFHCCMESHPMYADDVSMFLNVLCYFRPLYCVHVFSSEYASPFWTQLKYPSFVKSFLNDHSPLLNSQSAKYKWGQITAGLTPVC